MGKFYLVAAASVLLALAGSAEAGGRGRTSPGATFTPPGFSSNTVGQSHAGWSTTNNVTTGGVQPPGWSHNSTGQINGSWSDSIGGTGGIPGGLAGH